MEQIWNEMFQAAKAVQNGRKKEKVTKWKLKSA